MSYLIINGVDVSDLVSGLKVGYETLVSEDSGRNANGDTVLDVINRKVKLYVSYRPMDGSQMQRLLRAIKPYVVNVTYRDPEMNSLNTIQTYHGTPEPEYYWIHDNSVLYKAFEFNLVEL